MTVRASSAAAAAAMDAVIAQDASPIQSGDIDRWNPLRQMILDIADTLFDGSTMQAVVLVNDIISSGMIAPGAVTRDALANGSVDVDALITAGSGNVGPALRNALQTLPDGGRLGFQYLDGRITSAQAPANAVYANDIAAFRSESQINALVAAALTAAVTGNTETGITVTYAGGKLNFVVSGGSTTPTQPATFYYGVSPDNAFVATEYTAVPTQTDPAQGFVVPAPAANSFIAFAVPDTHRDLSYISRNHATGDNQFTSFDRIAGTILLGGVAHKAWRSDTIGFPAAVGGTWYVS